MAKETDPKVLDKGCPDKGAIAVCVKKGGKSRKVTYSLAESYFGAGYTLAKLEKSCLTSCPASMRPCASSCLASAANLSAFFASF